MRESAIDVCVGVFGWISLLWVGGYASLGIPALAMFFGPLPAAAAPYHVLCFALQAAVRTYLYTTVPGERWVGR